MSQGYNKVYNIQYMLLERDIKSYIANNFISNVLKQIPKDSSQTAAILTLTLKIDLTKTLRHNNSIGLFIIGDYPKFIKLVEDSVIEGMSQLKIQPPHYGVNISFIINNCPLPRHNLESVQFLSAAFEQEKGVLIYLKDAQVIKVYQPEMYLAGWEELWTSNCSCIGEKTLLKKRQSLIDIVKNKNHNIREAVIKIAPRCSQCNSKLQLVGLQDRYFMNCQKIKVLISARDVSSTSKEQLFQKGEMEIFLDENNTDRFNEGKIVDMCCYYSVEPRIAKISGQQITIKCESGIFMICSYASNPMSSNNNAFFSNLIGLSCEYIKCDDARDEDTICYNYKNLLKTVNMIRFPYLSENNLSTLKIVILNSLFNQMHQIKLHFMVISDEVNLLQQALNINGVLIKKWPTLYDNYTLIHFLNSCHNCILLIVNPSKKDFEYINNILNEKLLNNINFTLWIVTEPNHDFRKEVAIQKLQIVIDLSVQKNFAICRNVYDDMIDKKLQSFLQDSNEIILTVPRKKKKGDDFEYIGDNFEGVQSNLQEMQREGKIALKLLQKYFIRAREYKTITMNSLENIKNIAEGFAYFRSFLRQKGTMSSKKQPINILDAILAIFIQEETSRNKYSSSNTLFSNEISKLMLNQGDCQLSFWDYDIDEDDDQIGQSRKMIRKDEMFKRMVGKLMNLLYNHQVS